ncbi:MAG: hypothetical protein MHM6MM_000956 [Cercozoa sp. M6MM]
MSASEVPSRPDLSVEEVKFLGRDLLGETPVSVRVCESYDDQVFVLALPGARPRVVLKINHPGTSRDRLEVQESLRESVRGFGDAKLAEVIPAVLMQHELERNGRSHVVQVFSFLSGAHSKDVLLDLIKGGDMKGVESVMRSCGRSAAAFDVAAANFFDSLAQDRDRVTEVLASSAGHNIWQVERAAELVSSLVDLVVPLAWQRELIASAFADFCEHAHAKLSRMPLTVLHGDMNENNLLIDERSKEITGILDFGDVCVGHRVSELGVCLAYHLMHACDDDTNDTDLLSLVSAMVGGFHSVSSLSEEEQAVVYDVCRTRLAQSVTLSFRQTALPQFADDPYVAATRSPALRLLRRLDRVGRSAFLTAVQAGATDTT